MTSFGDFYYSGKSLLIRLLNVPINMLKYTLDPILRGRKAEEIIRNADIDFMKVNKEVFFSQVRQMCAMTMIISFYIIILIFLRFKRFLQIFSALN